MVYNMVALDRVQPKDPFKKITSIDDAIEVDNQLMYQAIPSDHVTVDTIRSVDSKVALEEFDYPVPLTHEGKTFHLDDKQVRDIYRYKNVLQFQYLETELDRIDVINVFWCLLVLIDIFIVQILRR